MFSICLDIELLIATIALATVLLFLWGALELMYKRIKRN